MKYTVRVTGSAFPEPVEFDVVDNVWWLKLLVGVGGITLSRNKVRLRYEFNVAISRNPFIIAHEAVHIQQARAMGWKYLPIYLWQTIKAGFNKDNIPMEQEAYIRQMDGMWTKLPS